MNDQNLDGRSITVNEVQSPSGDGDGYEGRCKGGGSGYNLRGSGYGGGGNGGGYDHGYNRDLSLHEFLYRDSIT
ncbi:hypothetical protein CDL15_Pgr026586 [Punica granatum]|uniref:Uncharacterized protein n=1 Tax=Punica granatum TaxID=22663 RepID=A0A218WKY4_PUNGR|nr:hypothetical protein CDL15_Pgr026586 [Punica granatum]